MTNKKKLLASVACGALLVIATASVVSADPGDGIGKGPRGNPPGFSPAATPELDSLLLFGSGLAGVLGYGALHLRARRRR